MFNLDKEYFQLVNPKEVVNKLPLFTIEYTLSKTLNTIDAKVNIRGEKPFINHVQNIINSNFDPYKINTVKEAKEYLKQCSHVKLL